MWAYFDGDEASRRPVWTCRLRSSTVTLRETTVLNTGVFVLGEYAHCLSKTRTHTQHTQRSGYSSQTSMTLAFPMSLLQSLSSVSYSQPESLFWSRCTACHVFDKASPLFFLFFFCTVIEYTLHYQGNVYVAG